MESFIVGNTVSKESVYESGSIYRATLDDAARRLKECAEPQALSNEHIEKGDDLLQTYVVESDPIRGGMGVVWRVRHNGWGVDLAMKRPQPRFFAEASQGRKEDFIAECEHWIRLGLHPNIVSCYYVREIGGVPSIFSEWMDGGSLRDAMASGALYRGDDAEKQERLLDIAIQTAQGLKYAHERGLTHQDVKPENILLTGDWEAKVADFGLARARSALGGQAAARSTGYTLLYCPKAQADGAEARPWMDVYAWALTMLELFAGRPMWHAGATAREEIDAWRGGMAVPLPERAARLFRGCLDADEGAGFGPVLEECLEIYAQTVGARYPRVAPRAVGRSADHMNNCALSYVDLGREDLALALWEEAERADARCVSAVYNAALYRYRHGLTDDMAAIAAVKSLDDGLETRPEALLALARIQLECRDPGLAETLDALERAGQSADAAELAAMREGASANRFREIYNYDREKEGPVEVSADGKYLLAHRSDGGARTESVSIFGIDDREPISTMIREPDNGVPSEVRTRLSHDNGILYGKYQKDPFVYKWRTRDGEQVNALIMRKLPGEEIMAFDFDARGERGILASNRGRVVFYDPVENRSKPFVSLSGHFGVGMSEDGSMGLAFCTEDNRVLVRGFDDGRELEIPARQPCFAHFVMGDACVLVTEGGEKPQMCLFDARTGERRYAVSCPLVHEFTSGSGQFSVCLDGTRMLLRVKKGFMLFDIPEHRWLFTITERHTGKHINLVFRSFLTDTGRHVFIDAYDGFKGYALPEFTEDSPWSLSVIHTTKERLGEENAFRELCAKARSAADAGDVPAALGHLAGAAAVGEGKYRSSEDYLSLVRMLSPRCAIRSVGDPLPIGKARPLTAPVSALSVSAGGDWIAALSEDGCLSLVDARTGEVAYRDRSGRYAAWKPARWAGNTLYALVMSQQEDGGISIGGGRPGMEGTMRISFMGQSLGRTSGGRVYAIDVGAPGELTASALEARFRDAAPAMPTNGVTDFAVLPGGAGLLYRRCDGPVCRHSRPGGTNHLLTIGDQCQISGMALSADGATAIQLCGDIMNFAKAETCSSLAVFFDVATGRELYRTDDAGITAACAFSGDGRWAVVGSELFDLQTGRRRKLGLDNGRFVSFLDDRFVAGVGADSRLAVYGLRDGEPVRQADVGERPTALACSPDRNLLYVGNARGELVTLLWDHAYEARTGTGPDAGAAMKYFWASTASGGDGQRPRANGEGDRKPGLNAADARKLRVNSEGNWKPRANGEDDRKPRANGEGDRKPQASREGGGEVNAPRRRGLFGWFRKRNGR